MKKLMRKLLAVVAALTMVLGISGLTAFAQTSNYTGTDASDGSITVTNTAAGHTYYVYKLFDAKSGSETDGAGITYSGTIPTELQQYFTYNSATNTIEVTAAGGSATELSSAAAEALVTWASTATALTSAVADQSGTIEFTGLPYGYYVVRSDLKQGGAVSVTSTNKHGEVHEKNNSDGGKDTDKKIVTGSTTDEDGKTTLTTASTSSAKIGDTVNYQITFTAVNYDSTNAPQTQYQVVDTNSGIDIKKDTIVVKVGENTLDSSAYTVSDGTTPLTITIPWANTTTAADGTVTVNSFKYDAPTTVTITYDAELTATTGSNSAQVNNGGPKPETHVYTTGFDLTKIDGDTKATLKGAQFELYEGTPTDVTKDDNGNITAVNSEAGLTRLSVSLDGEVTKGAYVVDTNGNATIEVNDSGKLTIKGLKANTNYYLKETQAPDGYTLPTKLFSLTTGNAGENVALTTGNLENTKGTELPSTGGMGTTIFYVLGAALVIGAGVVLVTRRRLSK